MTQQEEYVLWTAVEFIISNYKMDTHDHSKRVMLTKLIRQQRDKLSMSAAVSDDIQKLDFGQ